MPKRTLPSLPQRLDSDPQFRQLVERLAASTQCLVASGSAALAPREWLAQAFEELDCSAKGLAPSSRTSGPVFAWLAASADAKANTLGLDEEVRALTSSVERGFLLLDDFRVATDDGFTCDERTRRDFQSIVAAIAPGVRWRFYSPDYAPSRADAAPARAGRKSKTSEARTRGWGLLQFTRGSEELERLENELPGVCRFAGFSLSTRGAVASTALPEVRTLRASSASAGELLAGRATTNAPTHATTNATTNAASSTSTASDTGVSGIRFQAPAASAPRAASRSANTSAAKSAPNPKPAAVKRRVTLVTFGFKYGLPNTNYYFDVSFVKNPARDARWTLHSQPDDEMRRFVLEQPNTQAFLARLAPLVETLVECDDDVRVGLGCNSGRHRSIILAEELSRRLDPQRFEVRIVHREEEYR